MRGIVKPAWNNQAALDKSIMFLLAFWDFLLDLHTLSMMWYYYIVACVKRELKLNMYVKCATKQFSSMYDSVFLVTFMRFMRFTDKVKALFQESLFISQWQ